MITDNQLIHRQYLQSPAWRDKRLHALSYYGAICNRCGQHGTDVHHKTYVRVGGNERMQDLEVLCRACHEAHHQAERCSGKPKKKQNRSINRQAVFRCLTGTQKELICRKFGITANDLYIRLHSANESPEMRDALRALGMAHAYGFEKNNPKHFKGRRKPPAVNRMHPAFSCLVLPGMIGHSKKWENRQRRKNEKALAIHAANMAQLDKLVVERVAQTQ